METLTTQPPVKTGLGHQLQSRERHLSDIRSTIHNILVEKKLDPNDPFQLYLYKSLSNLCTEIADEEIFEADRFNERA